VKLIDRQPVEGTTPPIYIGHRTYRDPKTRKEEVSRTWYCEYCLHGERRYEPLKTSNKTVAIRAAHQIINRLESGQTRVPSRRIELEPLTKEYTAFITNKGRAPKTLQKYKSVLEQFATWAQARGIRSASVFSEDHFWQYRKFLADAELSDCTIYDRLILVKQFFKWAAKSGKIIVNPVAEAEIAEPESAIQPCFTPAQIKTLLTRAHPHERAIYTMMAFTGMRFGEIRDLRWTDLLLEEGSYGFVVIQRGGSGETTKGRRIRRIPIHPKLRSAIDRLPRKFERVFTARPSEKYPDGGGEIDERRLLRSLKRLCRRVGFPNPDQYKLHTFRHAFASMCARNSISYKYALEWMGHKSSEILDLYYTMYDDTAEAAIKTIEYKASTPKPARVPSPATS